MMIMIMMKTNNIILLLFKEGRGILLLGGNTMIINSLGVRHKRVSRMEWDNDVFEYMMDNDMVEYEYDYTNPKKYLTGTLLQFKKDRETCYSIISNRGSRRSWYDYCWRTKSGRKKVYQNSQILYQLNQKGLDFVRAQIVEQNL